MIKIKFSIVLLVFILLLNFVNAQNISLKIEEKLVLGDDENAPAEYLFHRIKKICTDSKNNIYVGQETSSQIRVFDKNGKLVTSIGRKGQGPGEFLDVTSMTIDLNNDLIVVDRMNKRITRYSNFGTKFETYNLIENHHIDPWNILQLNSKLFVINYLKKSNYKLGVSKSDKILHLYDDEFNIIGSIASAGEIWDFKQPFLISLVGSNFIRIATSATSDKIVISPGFYDGKLLLYEKYNDIWNFHELNGKKSKYKSYKQLDIKKYPNYNYPPYSMMSSTSSGKFLVMMQNMTRGLFILNDGKIFHYTFSQKNNKSKNYIELFDTNGSFLGFCAVEDRMEILWKDKEDNFYCRAASEEGFSIIKVYKLILDLK